jgi:hypothetical protein
MGLMQLVLSGEKILDLPTTISVRTHSSKHASRICVPFGRTLAVGSRHELSPLNGMGPLVFSPPDTRNPSDFILLRVWVEKAPLGGLLILPT